MKQRNQQRNPLMPRCKLDLTPSEARVWALRDKPTVEIARLLSITPKAVYRYMGVAKEKVAGIEALQQINSAALEIRARNRA